MKRHFLYLGACAVSILASVGAEAQTATPVWSSGFENGFPGEWLNYENGYSASGADIAGRDSTWTIIDASSGEPVFEGEHAYRGRISAAHSSTHRAYPNLHSSFASPYVNSFMVYLDADYDAMSASDWISFGTWSNDENWITLATLSVRDRKIEMAHVDWDYVGPTPWPDFPLRRWVRFTFYCDHTSGGTIAVWQDGVLVIQGKFASAPADRLLRSHWGMYASPKVASGTLYNDAIQIWTLSQPLSDFEVEPQSPFGEYLDGGAGGGGTGGGGTGGGGTGGGGTGGGGGGTGGGWTDGGTDDGGGDPLGVQDAGGCVVSGGSPLGASGATSVALLLLVTAALARRPRRRGEHRS